ncbi:MAG: hypothetical protein K6G30_00720 [Acetatifactor sp.]|jgi:5'-deoxynucleotidase YfbR-like HD superfamily hydrolase|nr:hypothetical protein [Acetatifactor sp.]
MNHITTYTGKHFEPTNPDPELFDVRDIAHALSLTCRGNGHVKTFFSVGQHCIYCAEEAVARGYSERVVLACLLHDAGEAYLSDVPRPFKEQLPHYREAENRMLDLIYTKFLGSPLTKEEERKVKEIDDDLLYFDLKELLGQDPGRETPRMHVKVSFDVRPFEEVERAYLALYNDYCIEV